jgi:hypothetical protein
MMSPDRAKIARPRLGMTRILQVADRLHLAHFALLDAYIY